MPYSLINVKSKRPFRRMNDLLKTKFPNPEINTAGISWSNDLSEFKLKLFMSLSSISILLYKCCVNKIFNSVKKKLNNTMFKTLNITI